LIAHRSIVALGFKVSGLIVGVPAVAACVFLTIEAIWFHHAAAPDGSHLISVRTYGLIGLMNDAAVGIDRVFGVLAGLAAWLFAGLAVVALFIALWAGLLYLVGRGVGRRALWARIVGGVFALILALANLLALTSLPDEKMDLAPLLLLGVGLYTLWTLIWRFDEPRATALPPATPSTDVGA
jgi:hypothetical protein